MNEDEKCLDVFTFDDEEEDTMTYRGSSLNTITSGGYAISTAITAGSHWRSVGAGNYQAGLRVAGDAEFEGDIKIKGISMSDRLDAIEERLGILRPNSDLEGKWENLKALGNEYRALEKDILEKEKIWDLLNK